MASDTQKRTCKGICKQFRVFKPAGKGRYESGQGRCQTCDVWLDYQGARLKNGSAATIGSIGWWCVCCNFRIRQKPRSRAYKEKLRDKILDKNTLEQNCYFPKIHKEKLRDKILDKNT